MSMTSPFRKLSAVQKLVVGIIILATVAIVVFSVYAINRSRPVDTATAVEAHIANLATDYYEHYFFPDLESSIHTNSASDISEVLTAYTETGFTKVPLRQILSHTEHSDDITNVIIERCDTNHTFVHFFPEPPFNATSYHTSYDYSCNF